MAAGETWVPPSTRRLRRVMLAWARQRSRAFPWRDTQNPYEILISELLLQRTQGKSVVPVYERLIAQWPTPEALASARVSSIAAVIRRLGLPKKAHTLKALGRALADMGSIPDEPRELMKLPGVGPYAAHAVPVFANNKNLPLVDWVIARVLRRYFGMPSDKRPNTDRALWELAERVVEPGRARDLWLGVLDFAAMTCRPVPLCQICPLRSSCAFYLQT